MHLRNQPKKMGESQSLTTVNDFSAELYEQHAAQLLAYLHKRLSSLHDAEDMLLDIFLVVMRYVPELQQLPADKQRAWLWTVANHRVVDYYRRARRRAGVPLEHIVDIEDEAHTPEQAILQSETDEQVRRWIGRLPAHHQEVLALRFTAGLACTEIAAVLQKSEGSIRTTLSRALNKLRRMSREQ